MADKQNKLLDVIQQATAKAVASSLVGDEEARKAIIAEAVSNVLDLKDDSIQRTMRYAYEEGFKQAVQEIMKAELATGEYQEKLQASVRAALDTVIVRFATVLPGLVEAAMSKVVRGY